MNLTSTQEKSSSYVELGFDFHCHEGYLRVVYLITQQVSNLQEGLYNIMDSDNYIIGYIICHVIDLTQLERSSIITYSEIDLFLIIRHLIYLIFLVKLF